MSRQIEAIYGFATFIPEMIILMRQGSKRVERKTPRFTRYIFVSCAPDDISHLRDHRMRGITRGITSILPEAIPDAHIDQWRAHEAKKIAPSLFRIGGPVRILEGPMAGFEGTLQSKDKDGRTIVMNVTILSRNVPVEIEATRVEPLL